jgi:hypothetical protein
MKIGMVGAMFSLGLSAAVLRAQTADDPGKEFRDGLLKQKVFLRNYSAQSRVEGHWDGNKVVMDKPFVGVLATILVNSVHVDSKKVEIDGVRHQMVKDTANGWEMAKPSSNVKITVHLNGGEIATIMPTLHHTLFYDSVEEAAASVPEYLLTPPSQVNPSLPPCDCADPQLAKCKKDNRPTTGGTGPILTQNVGIAFSEQAQYRLNAESSVLYIKVDESGVPEFLWVTKAGGYGLDEVLAIAAAKERYKPAICHGHPIPSEIYSYFSF